MPRKDPRPTGQNAQENVVADRDGQGSVRRLFDPDSRAVGDFDVLTVVVVAP